MGVVPFVDASTIRPRVDIRCQSESAGVRFVCNIKMDVIYASVIFDDTVICRVG